MKRSKKVQPKWRKAQVKKLANQRRQKMVMGVSFILFIGLLMLASFAFKLANLSVWDGVSRMAVVRQKGDQIQVEVLQPKLFKKLSIDLPSDLLVKAPLGYGEYRLKSIYSLGKLEGNGGKLLTRTVSNSLGVLVEGFKVSEKTNLSWWDRLRIWWFKSFKVKEKQVVDFEQELALRERKLNDGTRVLEISEGLVDNLLNQKLFDEGLANSGLSLAVLNASGVDGVARDVSRMLTNLGGEVGLISNLDRVDISYILVKDRELLKNYSLLTIKKMFKVSEVKIGDTDEYWSDIVLIVGDDYTQIK